MTALALLADHPWETAILILCATTIVGGMLRRRTTNPFERGFYMGTEAACLVGIVVCAVIGFGGCEAHAATLTWHAPARLPGPDGCTPGILPEPDTLTCEVWHQRTDSPLWQALNSIYGENWHRAAPLWRAWWPVIREDAGPRVVGEVRLAPGALGVWPANVAGYWWITSRDAAGNRSCKSNVRRVE